MAEIHHEAFVLVTGAGGRLGRLLRAAEARRGAAAEAPRFLFQSRRPGADLHWAPGDALSALPRCGTVVALWGVTSGDAAALAANTALVGRSVEVARACGASRLLHLSSAAIYGPGEAMNETRAPAPMGAYGHAKLAMEQAVGRLPRSDGLVHCCLRLANVVGADSLAPALRGDTALTLDRFSSGKGPLRSYISAGHLADVLRGLAALAPDALPEVLNISATDPVEMEALARAAGLTPAWREAPASAIERVTLDAGRLCTLLPEIPLACSAQAMIDNWRELESLA